MGEFIEELKAAQCREYTYKTETSAHGTLLTISYHGRLVWRAWDFETDFKFDAVNAVL